MQRPAFAAGLMAVGALVLCNGAEGALIDRGGGMIYDTDRNITWVSDADLFGTMRAADPGLVARIIQHVPTLSNGRTTHTLSTSDFASSPVGINRGLMTWWGATAFAQDLVFGGFDDWRLPTSMQPDRGCSQQIHLNSNDTDISQGTGCTGSELGHLFYDELGGSANVPLSVSHGGAYGLFSNVRNDDWTGTPLLVPSAGDAAWFFTTSDGRQQFAATGNERESGGFSYAWIVRSGDVLAGVTPNAVPEPAVVSLLFAGLGAIGGGGRRRTRRRSPGDAS